MKKEKGLKLYFIEVDGIWDEKNRANIVVENDLELYIGGGNLFYKS